MLNTNPRRIARWGYNENLKVLFIVISLIILVTVYKPMWLQWPKYSGDGTFGTCSSLVGGGYAIKFAEFDSAGPYSASYRLSHVPVARQRHEAMLYLRLKWSGSYLEWCEREKALTGKIRLILQDSEGRNIKSEELSLAEMDWTGTQGLYGGYDLERTRLHFESGKSYTLSVTYSPGAVPLPVNQVYFEIDNCAYK